MASHVTARRSRRGLFAALAIGITAILAVGITGAQADDPAEPELIEAALTYRTDVGPSAAMRVLAIHTAGAPPTEATTPASPTGELTIVATPISAEPCSSKDPRETGLGDTLWCLKLEGVVPGEPIVGTLRGDETALTLTVEARHDWRNPALWAAATLVVAIVVAALTLKLAPSVIANVQLGWNKKNEDDLTGLSEWSGEAQTNRLSTAAIVSRLRWAKHHGAAKVRATRTELSLLEANSPLSGAPLLDQAQAEVAIGQLVTATDILTADGKPAVSRAETLRRVLASAHVQHETFLAIADDLLGAIDGDEKDRAEEAKAMGAQAHVDFLQLVTFEAWQKRMADQLAFIHSLRLEQIADTLTASISVHPGPTAASPTAAGPGDIPGRRLVGQFLLASGLTLSVAFTLAVIATTTVLAGTYIPNTTFGTTQDYVVLTAGTLGSSAATSIVTLLLFLKSPNEWHA